ncbi:alpha/beta hydrolase [Rhodococcoides corynebacterioides]|uniref:alpha/beta hydrolase n=1 Tax=Rhodococcoides corynebacterioides TaxID=53972 RepID=UPI003F7F3C88
MHWVKDVSLLDGWFVTAMRGAAAFGAIGLLAVKSARYLRVVVPVTAAAAFLLTLVTYVVTEHWWRPIPDRLPFIVYLWVGLALFAVGLAGYRLVTSRRFGTAAAVLCAAVAVLLQSATAINAHFAYYPTVGTALGTTRINELALTSLPQRHTDPIPVSGWQDPGNLPAGGAVVTADIPGRTSDFVGRPAKIYLPPAYFAERRPLLPVLMLLAGQPGSPQDWLRSGNLVRTMDAFASRHSGLAPIIVVADGTGSTLANPLCVDSTRGNVATYLAIDVPTWIESVLQVDNSPTSRAVGGLSYGGTCALQLATSYPSVFPTFLDISGQAEPTLGGDRQRTIDTVFDGDAAAFTAINPLDNLRTRAYPQSGGVFVVGARDHDNKPGLRALYEAAKKAGMTVSYQEIPGGHDFRVWSGGLSSQIDAIAARLGISR